MKETVIAELRRRSTGPNSADEYLVTRKGHPIGVLIKFPDTPDEQNPWKAFRVGGSLVGFYSEKERAIAALAA